MKTEEGKELIASVYVGSFHEASQVMTRMRGINKRMKMELFGDFKILNEDQILDAVSIKKGNE